MIRLPVAAASVNQTPLDWSGNLARLRALVADARARGVALLTLPEMCITGYLHFDVGGIRIGFEICEVGAYRALGEAVAGRALTWQADDIALQNLQARVRAPSIWLLANLRNALLLTTSNRSEAAVGYATMDGDTCGGLAPLGGIDKRFLLAWLRWMETDGPAGIGPFPALAVVNALQPSAELRPPGAGQTDEDDLMPFVVLDVIERTAIRDKRSPGDVLEVLGEAFPTAPRETRLAWVERFFTSWCRNQWKRERHAPSFHLDDADLDPRAWCRFPILSGGYREELGELRGRP